MRELNVTGPGESGLVSVIVPTFQRGYILGSALESALTQTYQNVEIVVVDDGSTDNTRFVAESFGPRVRYLYQANAGVSTARNVGLRASHGEFIAFLDSDDQWLPWKLAAQIAFLDRHASAGMVWTDMAAVTEEGVRVADAYLRTFYTAYKLVRTEEIFAESGAIREFWPQGPAELIGRKWYSGDIFSPMLLGNLVHTSTVLMRRSWLDGALGFDESLTRGEDYGFHVQTCSRGAVGYLDVSSILYRVGAADQLTAPDCKLELALGNLHTVEFWLARQNSRVQLSKQQLRERMAESLAWLGSEELKGGGHLAARSQLSASLRLNPWQARTAAYWVMSLMPTRYATMIRKTWRKGKGLAQSGQTSSCERDATR